MLKEALKEQGIEVFEHSNGFMTYRKSSLDGNKETVVLSIYLTPEHRSMADMGEIFKEFEEIIVVPDSPTLLSFPVYMVDINKEKQVLTNLTLGFKIGACDKDRIIFVKKV